MTAESLEERQLELADKIVTVLAPPGWSDARVEAWLGEDATPFGDHAAIARPAGAAVVGVDIEAMEFEPAVRDHLASARAAETSDAIRANPRTCIRSRLPDFFNVSRSARANS